ncbi:hypothetical protein SAMN03080594_10371 [Arenibacter palladensis]|uniref:Uncharacterized protein n=1 Tax=Arenibacter palladensis TaxID=237373 RepID=A0A1M5A353_9FLAO|nr:hypothetical protein [Arenibacter palladensis]SHF24713.1 hypothetical protein SAMN03080594_10371 [Arenibacter palladensis]
MKKKLTPKYVLKLLSIIITTFVILSTVGKGLQLYIDNKLIRFFVKLFYLDNEMAIPTFYSACALMISALILLVIGFKKKEMGNKHLSWIGLGLVFMFLSFDEICVIHEHLSGMVQNSFKTTGFLYYGWVIPYGILILFLGITYFRFVMDLPSKVRFYIILSGAIFLMGAVGIEMVTAKIDYLQGEENWAYIILMTIEEAMEMFGIALFIYTLFLYINIEFGALKITVKGKKSLKDAKGIHPQDQFNSINTL